MANINPKLLQAVVEMFTKLQPQPVIPKKIAGGVASDTIPVVPPKTDSFAKSFDRGPGPTEGEFSSDVPRALDNESVTIDQGRTVDAASAPLRADEVVNPTRQKFAEQKLDLEGEQQGQQMDMIQDIIDADPTLSALSPTLLKETMPDIIKNNRNALGIKTDTSQVSTSVFEKLNDLAESAKTDPALAQKVQTLRAQAAQASERNDDKTLQMMLEQLTGTDAGLEGLERFGRSRPDVPNDPTGLPINIPDKGTTATMEQIMQAVTQELGIK